MMLSLFSFLVSAGWIGKDAVSPIIGEHDPYVNVFGRVNTMNKQLLKKLFLACLCILMSLLFMTYTCVQFQELTHLRGVAVLMTFIMAVAILTSIAIVRRILMATSVLKVKHPLYEM